jgi:chromosomal replication initiation ATPase DnaA
MNIEQIISIVSEETKVSVSDIVNPSRKSNKVFARHLSMWACRWYSNQSLQKIAAAHNRKQHGSVINGSTSIENQMKYNPKINQICQNIINQVK